MYTHDFSESWDFDQTFPKSLLDLDHTLEPRDELGIGLAVTAEQPHCRTAIP